MARASSRNSKGQDSRERQAAYIELEFEKRVPILSQIYIFFHSSCTATVWSRNIGKEQPVYSSSTANNVFPLLSYICYTHVAHTHTRFIVGGA